MVAQLQGNPWDWK